MTIVKRKRRLTSDRVLNFYGAIGCQEMADETASSGAWLGGFPVDHPVRESEALERNVERVEGWICIDDRLR